MMSPPPPSSASSDEKISKFYSPKSLYFEKERRKTFIDWPIPHNIISPEDLASNGFYYLREKDYVCCIFCNGMLGDWKLGDIVQWEHEKHFPNCRFLKPLGDNPLGNIPLWCSNILDKLPIKGEENPIYLPDDLYIFFGNSSMLEQIEEMNNGNIKKFQDYISLKSRMESFTNQPMPAQQWPVGISVEKMATAGFFYIGKKKKK